jgi:hypothetical protein
MSPSLYPDESERLPRQTVDEIRISDQARAMLDGKGCDEYRRLGNAETGKHRAIDDTCLPAFALNEHDPAMFRDSPIVTHGGSHAQLSTGARNSLTLAAACVVLSTILLIVYLVIISWPLLVAGIRNLSSW